MDAPAEELYNQTTPSGSGVTKRSAAAKSRRPTSERKRKREETWSPLEGPTGVARLHVITFKADE
jgi:hypothetical protein